MTHENYTKFKFFFFFEIQILMSINKFAIMLNIHLPYDPETLFLGIYPRKTKTYIHKNLYAKIYSLGFIHSCLKLDIS